MTHPPPPVGSSPDLQILANRLPSSDRHLDRTSEDRFQKRPVAPVVCVHRRDERETVVAGEESGEPNSSLGISSCSGS